MPLPLHFASVERFEPAQKGTNGRLHLVGGAVLEVLGNHPLYRLWANAIRLGQEINRPLFVETAPDSQMVMNIWIPHAHQILSVAPGQVRDQHEVICHPCPSPYLLSGDNPRKPELLEVLRNARENRTRLWVTPHPNTREILDARPV